MKSTLAAARLWMVPPAAICLAAGLSSAQAWAGDAADAVRLDVYPPDVNLFSAQDRQPLVVVITRPDGVTTEVTTQAKFTLADSSLARIDADTVYPLADGQTTLSVEYEGRSASIPVQVSAAGRTSPVSFKLDVMPVFTRAGCNTGSCHGAAHGKDGFRLSLFGFDPGGDYFRLTRELGYR